MSDLVKTDLRERGEYFKQYYIDNRNKKLEYQNEYNHDNKEKHKEYNRERHAKNKDYIRKQRQEYYEKNKEKILKRGREYYHKNKEKCFSHYYVKQALLSGELKKLPCLLCGVLNVEAHHPDYSKPLDVVWLCPTHHRRVHSGAVSLEESQ